MIARLRISGLVLTATALLGTTLVAQDPGEDERDRAIRLRLKVLRDRLEHEDLRQPTDGPRRLRFEPAKELSLERRPPVSQEARRADLGGFEDDPQEEERPPEGPLELRNHILDRACFDRWMFGKMTTDDLRGRWLGQLLEDEIARLGKVRPLTGAQEAKLRLAGKGDIARFYAQVDRKKREFETARMDVNSGLAFLQEIEPLSAAFREGPSRGDSLLRKTYRFMTE